MLRIFSALFISTLVTGCVAAQGDESFVIVNNLVPMIDATTGALSFVPAADGPFFSSQISSFFAESVVVGSMFVSRIQAAEGKESLRTISIQGANIDVQVTSFTFEKDNVTTFVTPTTTSFQYNLPFSSSLGPNGGISVGIYDLIPPDVMASLRQEAGSTRLGDINAATRIELLTTTTAFGDFYGDRLDSTPFQFPVFVTQPISCGDLVCDPLRETVATCPVDCICGNGTCDTARGETNTSCPGDCPLP